MDKLRRSIGPALALFLLVAFASTAPAQTASPDSVPPASWIERGSVVRVTVGAERERAVGTLLRADSLIALRLWDGSGRWSVDASRVRMLEVRTEQRAVRRHRHGALAGFLIGAVPTLVAAAAVGSGSDGSCDDGPCLTGGAVLALGVPFTLVTTGLGALVDHVAGGGASEDVRWKPVLLPVRIMPADTASGTAP